MERTLSWRETLVLAGVLTALVVIYAFAWDGRPQMEGDSQGYLDVAAVLRDSPHDRLPNRPPGYPVLLLLTGSVPEPGLALLVTQLALHAAAVALLAGLLRRIDTRRALVALFVGVAMLPPFVEHADFVLSESLAQICVVAGLVGFSSWLLGGRASWLVLAAGALAAAPLVHSVDELLWVALSIVAALAAVLSRPKSAFRRRTVIGVTVISLAAVTVLGGVVVRNAIRFDFAGVSPMLGTRLSHKTVRVLERLPERYADVREILIRHRDGALLDPATGHLGLAYIFRAVPELQAKTGMNEQELSRYLVELNLALIRAAPMDYVDEVLRSAIWFWAPGVTDQSGFGSGAVKAAFNGVRALVLVSFFGGILLLAGPIVLLAGGAIRRGQGSDLESTPLWPGLVVVSLSLGAIAYDCLVSITLTSAVYRLRIPVDLPILACALLAPGLFVQIRAALGLTPAGR
ncbi:MAG: hypothetical protein IT386_14830 [Deltaproteobacteria bacterium]|nr:hypothetical protein [Deltaproteobacteria bacterium]